MFFPSFLSYKYMRKVLLSFITMFICANGAFATTRDAQLTNTTPYNYNYMYPYLNNQMRTDLNPGVTPTQSSNLINTVVRTEKMSGERRVVPRKTARSATVATTANSGRRVVPRRTASTAVNRSINTPVTSARSGINMGNKRTNNNSRQVVARSGRPINITLARNASDKNYASQNERASTARCMADYSECMDMYCERKNTAYNRCYCSAKLSQIDAKYQPEIESLIMQIQTIKTENKWSDSEMNEYWMETVGKYTNGNTWENIDNALNKINWADFDSKLRGQNAFNTGHEYCIQHLQNCSYAITNLRDAYRSEITRNCAAYEENLILIKNAAESIISSYKE